MSKLDINTIPATKAFHLRWSDGTDGTITVRAYAPSDKEGETIGELLASASFPVAEASEANRVIACAYGLKKKIQDDAAQWNPDRGYTLRDKFESFLSTWETMQSDDWNAKRKAKAGKLDLYRLAAAACLGKGIPIDSALGLMAKLQTKTADEIKAFALTDFVQKGLPLYDARLAELAESADDFGL